MGGKDILNFVMFVMLTSVVHQAGAICPSRYKICNWVGWASWSNCTCEKSEQIRYRMICCPENYTSVNIESCVLEFCNYTLKQYTEKQTCTPTTNCTGSIGRSIGPESISKKSNVVAIVLGTIGGLMLAGCCAPLILFAILKQLKKKRKKVEPKDGINELETDVQA